MAAAEVGSSGWLATVREVARQQRWSSGDVTARKWCLVVVRVGCPGGGRDKLGRHNLGGERPIDLGLGRQLEAGVTSV
ncbi:vegetative cell wall protein gp1-like [Iris pallida]|uniref:Vegetative cell wall protein gp1-like n=1 Tax=Iris pallida TaxID=29817 RepID=A0AAX6DHC7_IRIPA|nr:vegetative cell wall protein gp1-like [Iris pallida]